MTKNEKLDVYDLLPKSVQNTKELTAKRKNVLAQLIYLDNGMSEFKSTNDGWFYRDNKTLSKECNITEANLLPCLAKLQQMGFIERRSGNSTSRTASYYKICWDNINAFDGKTIVVNNSSNNSSSKQTIAVQEVSVDWILDIKKDIRDIKNLLLLMINNSSNNSSSNNSSNNSIDIDIDIDIELEIEKELDLDLNKDLDLIENNNNNKEIKEDAVENTASLESTNKIITDSNDELESDTNTNNTMNYKTRINIETLTARMSNSISIEELEDKNTKFHKWLDTKLDNEELTSTEYTQQIEDINKVYNETYSKLDNEPTEESETILDEIVSDFFSSNDATKQQNTELGNIIIPTTKTKEQIAADLEDFKNSLASYENKEEAINNLKWYGNKWDKEIVSNDMLTSYQELLNYVTHGDKEKNDDITLALTIEDDVTLQLENFKSSMFNYNSQKEAKKEFNSLVSKLDKEIIDLKLEELVKEIYDSINRWSELNQETPSVSQIKPTTETFNTPSSEAIKSEEKVSEKALKYPTREVVIKEDSAEPKLHTTANTGTSVESKALAMSIFYKKPLDEVMREIEASRASRGGIIVEEDYPF